MKSIFILIISSLIILSNNLDKIILKDSNECNAELNVEKNRSVKSAGKDGASFKFTLKNTSQNTLIYSLNTSNLDEPCGNKNMKSSGINVVLDATFIMDNTQLINNEIELSAGETKSFIVQITVPEGTPYYNWGCTEVVLSSLQCTAIIAKKTLSVYVPNPYEE